MDRAFISYIPGWETNVSHRGDYEKAEVLGNRKARLNRCRA